MIKFGPVDVDVEKIAGGVLEMLTKDEQTALQLGMLPAGKMAKLEEYCQDRLLELVIKKIRREIVREIVLQIMMNGRLVV